MSSKLNLTVNFLGVDKMSGAIRNIIGAGRSGSQSLRDMASNTKMLERSLASVRREIANTSGNVTNLVERERALAQAVLDANEAMRQQSRINAIDERTANVTAKAEEYKQRGMDNMVAGASLAAPFIVAVKAAADFSSGMVDIQQKANLSNRETAQLRDNILAAAAAARQMPESMRSAVDVLSGKGLDPRRAAIMVPAIGRLGTAFKVDLADGAAAAYANLNNLKVPINQTSAALDIMAASGNMGAFEIRDMARHFPALTAKMQALGESGLDAVGNLSAALQIAEKGAGTADQAANNIQNLLAKINSPATINAFRKNFGVDLPAQMKKLTDAGMDSFEAIALITKQATGGDLKKLGFGFEDMQAQDAIRSLIQNLDEYRKIRDTSLNAGGTIDKAFDQRLANDASVSWEAFKATLSTLMMELGSALLPAMNAILGKLASGARWVGDWARANPQLTKTIMALVVGFAGLRIGIGAVQFLFGGLLGPIGRLWGMFSKLGFIMRLDWMGLGRSIMFIGRAFLMAGRALMLNPIGLLVTVIAGAAYLIYIYWDEIKAAFSNALVWLKGYWDWLSANATKILAFTGPIGYAASLIITHWDTIKGAFSSAINWLYAKISAFTKIGGQIISGLVSGITAAGGKVWAALKHIVMGGINNVKSMLGIRSPSRVFMGIGGYAAEGMALGIDKRGNQAMRSMSRLASGITAAAALAMVPANGQVMGSRGTGAGSLGAPVAAPITINVYAAPGQDADAIARQVMQQLERAQGNRHRATFEDY